MKSPNCSLVIRQILDNPNKFQLYLSEPILQEYLEKLANPKIKKYFKYSENQVDDFLEIYKYRSVFISPKSKIDFPRDPKDPKFLELAREIQADYIVTGDSDLLDLGSFEVTKVVRPKKFLESLKS